MTAPATEVVISPAPTDAGDHDLFSHYVRKAEIARAAVEGTPVRAVCGKVWVPTKDGERFPICSDCKRIYESLPA